MSIRSLVPEALKAGIWSAVTFSKETQKSTVNQTSLVSAKAIGQLMTSLHEIPRSTLINDHHASDMPLHGESCNSKS